MTDEQLEATARHIVSEELRQLPDDLARAAAHVVICIQALPAADDPEIEPDWLGVFEGCSLMEEPPSEAADLPRITLFWRNIWEEAGYNPQVYRDEVRITFRHELGHFLGWDEDEVEKRGLG